jgi:hypothetical protein
MILVNETPFAAQLLTTVLDEERMMASVLARLTYTFPERPRVGAGPEVLTLAPEQPWPVSRKPLETPRGTMEQDLPFMKGGVDLFLFGVARAPRAVAVPQMEVRIELGAFARRATVFGKRVWVREGRQLVPSRPAAFLEMPLTLAHAFGGAVEWDGLEVPWGENPKGLGFCIDEARAEGQPLPNLEEPDSPMRAWSDKPTVCGFGFCPMVNPGRFRSGAVLTEDHQLEGFRPQIFNAAYTPMVAPDAKPGDVVRIAGVLHEGPLELALPAPPFGVRLEFGSKVAERVPSIEQVGIEVEERRAFVTYRFPFRYTVRPRELRQATIVARERGEEA